MFDDGENDDDDDDDKLLINKMMINYGQQQHHQVEKIETDLAKSLSNKWVFLRYSQTQVW